MLRVPSTTKSARLVLSRMLDASAVRLCCRCCSEPASLLYMWSAQAELCSPRLYSIV